MENMENLCPGVNFKIIKRGWNLILGENVSDIMDTWKKGMGTHSGGGGGMGF